MRPKLILFANQNFKAITTVLTLLYFAISHAQTKLPPPLEREVTIKADNLPLDSILNQISHQTQVIFSYNPEAINSNQTISIYRKKKPVRMVLNDLFGEDISYKSKGNYIILKKKSKPRETEYQIIEGYIFDEKTGDKLTEASIYDNKLEASAVTDQYGHFYLEIPANKSITSLRVSKAGYADTMLLTDKIDKKIQNIEINTKPRKDETIRKFITNLDLPKYTPQWLIPKKLKINAVNINDSVLSFAQISLAPMLSTNRFMAGNITNKLSFNATVGYVQGVEIAEFGGIINIDLANVKYAQFAGVGNFVGGSFLGYQSAGVINYAHTVTGVQNGGVLNISAKNADVQIGGVGNFALTSLVQTAGVINVSDTCQYQVAGVVNVSRESNLQISGVVNAGMRVRDIAIAGVANVTAGYGGEVQIAGVVNASKQVDKLQVSGCVNVATKSVGSQVGIVNEAGFARNSQTGILNIADSCNGIPIGVLSLIRNGYHQLEFSTDELLSTTLTFRTGVKRFHTFVGVGSTNLNYALWNFGYGLGTSLGNSRKTAFDFDFYSRILFDRKNSAYAGYIHTLFFGIDQRLTRKLGLVAGVTYNLHFTNNMNSHYISEYSQITPYSLGQINFTNGTSIRNWFGGKIGLRLF